MWKFDRQPGLLNKITKNNAQNNQNPALLTNVKVKIFKTDLNNDNRVHVTLFIVPKGTKINKFC